MAHCGACGKKVAKSAKALACDCCRLWYRMSCAGLTDSDYDFMKTLKGRDGQSMARRRGGYHTMKKGRCLKLRPNRYAKNRRLDLTPGRGVRLGI